MVRVLAPTTALLIFGVVCCKSNCVECAGRDKEPPMDRGRISIDENVGGTDTANSNGAINSNNYSNSNNQVTSVNIVDFRPPSPAPSLTSMDDSSNFEKDEAELISFPIMSLSGSIEYDGDCERTPNHLYRAIIEEIPKRLSGFSNILTDQLSKIENGLDRYNGYGCNDYNNSSGDEDDGHLLDIYQIIDNPNGNSDNIDDENVSSSHDSLAKTRGGSKSSNCATLKRVSGRRIKPSKKSSSSIIPEVAYSADSCDELVVSGDIETVAVVSRSESPFRSSRVNSIENEMAVAPEGSIENQIFKEVYPKVSNGPHCKILDKIDQLASEELQKFSKQIGTFIFEHLWHQITQINPDKPFTVIEAYEFFDLLNEIYAQVISIHHQTSGIRFELCQLIEECLKATLIGDFNKFKPVRDAILLLILNHPNYFDDEFLETIEMYETLRTIVHLSDENEYFDTLEYIRVIFCFPNLLDLQQYFDIFLKKPKRKPSDDLFLPLMEVNLIHNNKISEKSNGASLKVINQIKQNKSNKNKNKKNVQKFNRMDMSINNLIWENRFVVLLFGLLLAIIIQCLFLQK